MRDNKRRPEINNTVLFAPKPLKVYLHFTVTETLNKLKKKKEQEEKEIERRTN